jgi:hypothetical protein
MGTNISLHHETETRPKRRKRPDRLRDWVSLFRALANFVSDCTGFLVTLAWLLGLFH